jgi:hypothetical protein
MSDTSGRYPIALKRLVYQVDGMADVAVIRDVAYRVTDAGPQTMDVYRPREVEAETNAPVVIIVTGYQDVGVPRPLGCAFKDMEMVISLAQLIAAAGIAAVAYTTREPAADIRHVVEFLARNTAALRADTTRVGLWAASGNVPVALALLMERERQRLSAAVLSNGFTLDVGGSAVADASRTYRFVNAAAGKSVADLPADVPLFIARSGRDEFPGLNTMLDRFVAAALARNLPITFVNHATAPHGFELNDDSDTSRHIIGQMLEFLTFHLRA